MSEKRFVVQVGMGVDQHGHDDDCTVAAKKAIKDAISNNCLAGLVEVCGLNTPRELLSMRVHVKIGAPFPEKINEKKVLRAVPFGKKTLEVVRGGLSARGIKIEQLGDTSERMIICIAAVTVSVLEL